MAAPAELLGSPSFRRFALTPDTLKLPTREAAPHWVPSTEEEKAAVWEQVDRLIRDPSFNKSKRYPSLLRFVVAKSLDGEADCLKERVLGMEVFDRPADYDSTRDSIVRVTAAELRKRMLHYYDDPVHRNELRVSLPSGSYVPQFAYPVGWLVNREPTEDEPAREEQISTVREQVPVGEPAIPSAKGASRFGWLWGVFATVALALIATASVLIMRPKKEVTLDAFWAPAFRSSAPILICFNDHPLNTSQLLDAANPEFPTHPMTQAQVMSASSVPLIADITRYFSEHGRVSRIQGQSKTTFDDIRGTTVILFGAYNNYWTLKMTQPLRFHFANSPDMSKFWIEDRESPASRDWSTETNVKVLKDYALLARFVPPSTGQTVFVIAGLRPPSMTEGVKLLLSPQLMDQLGALDMTAERNKNVEIIIQTDVVEGVAGKPKVLAVHTW